MTYLNAHTRRTSVSKNDLGQPMGRQPALMGVYMGYIKDTTDVQKNGRLRVWIPELGSVPDNQEAWMIVNYCSPFAGATNVDSISEANVQSFEGTQTSYGMWMIPPDINNIVAVMFINGDPSRGIWIGCLLNQYMNNMIPGMAASTNNYQYPGKNIPVAEYNKWDPKASIPDSATKPYEKTKFQGLGNQGLINDPIRGTTSSSARRESPSGVFGIITPGPIINSNVSPENVRRKGGSSFIMDDGVGSEYVQLSTKTGAQIRIDETNGFIYLINRDGTAWVQMDKTGNIDIFGANSISLRAQQDFNIRADGNVNIEAGQNVFIKAAMDTTSSTTTFTYDVNNIPTTNAALPLWKNVGEGNGTGGNIVMQALNDWQSTTKNSAFLTVINNNMNIDIGTALTVTTITGGQDYNSALGIKQTTGAALDIAAQGNIRIGSQGSVSFVSNGDFTVCTNANLFLNSSATMQLTADTEIDLISGSINLSSTSSTGGTSLSSAGSMAMGSTGNMSSSSSGEIILCSNSGATIKTPSNIILASAGDTIIEADNFEITTSGNIVAGSSGIISLQGTDNLIFCSGQSLNFTATSDIQIASGGNILLAATNFGVTAETLFSDTVGVVGVLTAANISSSSSAAPPDANPTACLTPTAPNPPVCSTPAAITPAPLPIQSPIPANSAQVAEVKGLNTKINILATWADSTPTGPYVVFSTTQIYQPSTIVKYTDSSGNSNYYSANIVQGPGPFISANWTLVPISSPSKFKRNSQSVQTTVSRLATYEPCPEHSAFKSVNISTPIIPLTTDDKTYGGSAGAGNTATAAPPPATAPGTDNSVVKSDPAAANAFSNKVNIPALQCQLSIHEGIKYVSYLDSRGLLTGGIGHLLRSNEKTLFPLGSPITADQVTTWFQQDVSSAITIAQNLVNTVWGDLSDIRKRAVCDLAYNLGGAGLAKFKQFLAAMNSSNFSEAGNQLRSSAWFTQVGKRGTDIITMIVQDIDPNHCDQKFPPTTS